MADGIVTLRSRADTSGVTQLDAAYKALSTTEQRAARDTIALAQAYARLDAAQGRPASGAALLRNEYANLTAASSRQAVAVQTQIANLDRLGQSSSFASEFTSGLKSGLLGIVGPAALAATAIGAVKGAIDFSEEAFKLKASLDQSTAAIAIQTRNIRDNAQTMASAAAFAEKYAFTQQETNQALLASVGILRSSRSSAEDVLGVLARLQIASPEQSLQDAALAVKELASGDITSLVKRFEISRSAANAMKEEIKGGADVIQVLNKYLGDSGIGMEALALRAQGATGRMNELTRETERLKIILAGQEGGTGLAILNTRIALTRLAQDALFGMTAAQSAQRQATDGEQQATSTLTIAQRAQLLVTGEAATATTQLTTTQLRAADADDRVAAAALRDSTALSEEAKKKVESQIATAQLAAQQRQLEADSALAARGLLGAGDQALLLASKYGIAAGQAQFLINQQQALANATALADQRVGERTGGRESSAAELDAFSNLRRARVQENRQQAEADKKKAEAEQQRITAARNALNLERARTPAQKIAELQRQQAATTDQAEKLRLQAQIEQERNSQAKAHTGELSKQLNLNERIRDSIESQYKASLDIAELSARDRLDRIKERQELAAAQRILASGSTSAAQKEAAAAKIDLINAQQAKRALEISEKQATAGGTIVNGRVFQSIPAGGAPAGAVPRPVGPIAPVAAGGPAPAVAGGAGTGVVQLVINLDGKTVAQQEYPYLVAMLMESQRQASAAGRGSG